jgi:hypothetical protein
MLLTLAQVVEHYGETRQFVYRQTEQAFASLGVHVRAISDQDAAEADAWPDIHGVKSWSWQKNLARYRREPKRFDIAIAVGGRLCALAMGVPSRGRITLKIHVLERRPEDNPIKGRALKVILLAAHAYAGMIGSREVWLCHPASEALVAVYEKLQYSPVRDRDGRATHLKKDV